MQLKRWLILSFFLTLTAALLAAVLTPSFRDRIRQRFSKSGREILATAEGDVMNSGVTTRVIKFRTPEGIFVEILRGEEGEATFAVVDRVQLPDRHDGLFNFKGHVTRLAIGDVDGDGKQELLAPTFDDQLVPHLNVFRYNPAIGKLEPFPAAPAP